MVKAANSLSPQASQQNISFFNTTAILNRLFPLLKQQALRYTLGDRTSIPAEIADELLSSITFTISVALDASPIPPEKRLSNENLEDLFKEGQSKLPAFVSDGKILLTQARHTLPPIYNRALVDTLADMDTFFARYDQLFMAHHIPCSIDYPLCHPVSERLSGIVYLNDWLRRLLIENTFCAHFTPDAMLSILKNSCPDYKEQLINLYECIAINALGRSLLDLPLDTLALNGSKRRKLFTLLAPLSHVERIQLLAVGCHTLCQTLKICSPGEIAYLKLTFENLLPRLNTALASGQLSGVFLRG